MDRSVVKINILKKLWQEKKNNKTYNDHPSSRWSAPLRRLDWFGSSFKHRGANASVLQSPVRWASLFLISSSQPPPPICPITDRYRVTGESANEEAMLAVHVAASLIAAFTAEDDGRWAPPRIFRSASRRDCAAGDLLKGGRKWPPLIHLFPADSIYYCLCIAHKCSSILYMYLHIFMAIYWCFGLVFFSRPQVFGEWCYAEYLLSKIFLFACVFLFSWFAPVFLICICFVKLQLSWSPLGSGPGLAGMTTIEWISI